MLGLTVPNKDSNNREGPIADGVRQTFSDSEEADRMLLRASKSAAYSSLSARYDGAAPITDTCTLCQNKYERTVSHKKGSLLLLQ